MVASDRTLVLEELAAIEPIDIASVVSSAYVFDFLILYESLLNSWTFYPFRLHAYTAEAETFERLSLLELAGVDVHRLPEPAEPGWWGNVLAKIDWSRCRGWIAVSSATSTTYFSRRPRSCSCS